MGSMPIYYHIYMISIISITDNTNRRCGVHSGAFTLPYKCAPKTPQLFPHLCLHGTSMILLTLCQSAQQPGSGGISALCKHVRGLESAAVCLGRTGLHLQQTPLWE